MYEDSKMVDTISRTMQRSFTVPQAVGPTSLNLPYRKQTLKNINKSNLKLLSRLQSVESNYSAKDMKAGYKQSQKYLLNSSYSLRKRCEKLAAEYNRRVLEEQRPMVQDDADTSIEL
jgi:hypothetical protein